MPLELLIRSIETETSVNVTYVSVYMVSTSCAGSLTVSIYVVNYLVSALVEAFIRSLWTKCCLPLALKMRTRKGLEIEEEREPERERDGGKRHLKKICLSLRR